MELGVFVDRNDVGGFVGFEFGFGVFFGGGLDLGEGVGLDGFVVEV